MQVAELNHVAPRQVLHHRQQHVLDLLAGPVGSPGGLRERLTRKHQEIMMPLMLMCHYFSRGSCQMDTPTTRRLSVQSESHLPNSILIGFCVGFQGGTRSLDSQSNGARSNAQKTCHLGRVGYGRVTP